MLVVTTWLPTTAAPEIGIFVERDIDLLARDHDVDVVHLSASSDPVTDAASAGRPHSVRTIRMSPTNPLSVAAAARQLRELLPGYDLVHTMAASALLPFRTLHPTSPWVHTEHWSAILAPSTVALPARLALPLTMRLLTRPDVVVAVGSLLAEAIGRRRLGSIATIPNAVDKPGSLVEPRRDGVLRLIGVGGLIERKGPDVAVQALAELVRRGRDATLVWVGDGPLRSAVETLAARLGVADRVGLKGRTAPEEVPSLLAEAEVFLLPTEGETFGVAIAEALMNGRPVVVGAQGGQTDFVHEPDGVLVSGRTGVAYADAVERVIELNAGRSAADVARVVSERFTDDARRDAYAAVYAEAEGAARGRA
ncbi:hypothetical protein ASF62_05065 [Leifsonia sp. Leaf325]|nr:hypothetical protein ASF62_05065 [Leifsonia sp. Leaf325]